MPPIYIVSAARTPIGAFLGELSSQSAAQLGAVALSAALKRADVDAASIDEVYMGHVLTAGAGQAPARQAALGASLPNSVPCTGIAKVCGSGLEAVILACRAIATGDRELVLAGGMESMSRAPYYLEKAREGYRLGNSQLIDGMIHDGLWDPYGDFHMGEAAELCADRYECSREAQDTFARQSYERALAAQAAGQFADEIAEVTIPQRRGDSVVVNTDEEPGRGKLDKFAKLRPAFKKNGTITAANASSINDGAAALTLASEQAVKRHGLKPIAKVSAWGGSAHAPEWFTTAPIKAINNTLARLSLKPSDIDLWEINEAFSCVTMACSNELSLDADRVNVNGGAVALGHPIGASGARILTTLLYALQAKDKRRGLATLCIGGGEGVALAVERL